MSKEKISILLADNNPPEAEHIRSSLGSSNDISFSLDTAETGHDAISKASDADFDVLILGQDRSGTPAIKTLQEVIKKKLGVQVILIVAEGDEKLGVKAMDRGASDYLTREEIKTDALNRAVRRALQRKKLENEIRESLKKMEMLAIRDGLTGLFNRRHLHEVLRSEFRKYKRHMQSLSCIMIDLDYFKAINDNYGHQFGDFVLAQSAQILKRLVRDTDTVARYGGEEFIIILPNTDLQGAFILAERIRKVFVNNKFTRDGISETVTISSGISSTTDVNVAGDSDLIANADKALYRAKWRGRNNVCYFEELEADDALHFKEELKKLEDFHSKFENINEHIKESCIESAHDILRQIERGWDHFNTHSVRVSGHAGKMARALSLSADETRVLKRAALLHDIGMVGVSSRILRKKDRLTEKEYNLVKRHTTIGVRMMERTKLFQRELPIILHHHERFDGSGYPHGLEGDRIPLGARILSIADAYDAMRTATDYRKASSVKDSMAELKDCAGTQFDPRLVNAFIKTLEASR